MIANKIKAFCFDKVVLQEPNVNYLCLECERVVGRNSICCEGCLKWVHKRSSNVKSSLSTVKNFKCKKCCRMKLGEAIKIKVKLGSDEIKVVEKFCYLGDVCTKKLEYVKHLRQE